MPSSWLQYAEDDLDMAQLSLREGKFNYTCFFCHQAVEKSLKGLLVLNKVSPPRIHNLVELSQIYGKIDNEILKFRPDFNQEETSPLPAN